MTTHNGADVPDRHRFGRAKRLSGDKAFARVFGGRRSAGDQLLGVYAMPHGLPFAKLSVSVERTAHLLGGDERCIYRIRKS